MGMRGKSLLLGAALVVAGCAEAAPGSSGGESQAPEVGTRVEGSVKLVDDGGGTCLAVRYKQDGAVVEVPLALLMDPAQLDTIELQFGGRARHVFQYRYQPQRIWGVTASILYNLRERLAGSNQWGV